MKKLIVFVLTLVCLATMAACDKHTTPQKKWEYTITCAEESAENAYVISYIDDKIISNTGILTFENKNDFDVIVHLTADGKERAEKMEAGGILTLYQLVRDTEYTLGFHADVSEGTEIIVLIFDGEGNVLSN